MAHILNMSFTKEYVALESKKKKKHGMYKSINQSINQICLNVLKVLNKSLQW